MRNKHGISRDIPEPIAREIRKRDGFGCVVCGNAFFQYDHFDPEFHDAVEHRAEGIALLCLDHHGKKGGLLSDEDYQRARREPAALKRGHAATDWTPGDSQPEILVGPLTFVSGTSILRIGEELLFGFELPEQPGAPPRLLLRVFDRDGVEAFGIRNNEIRCLNEAFDIVAETRGSIWTVRSAVGKIDLDLRFDLPTRVTIQRLNMKYGSWEVKVNGQAREFRFNGEKVDWLQGTARVRALKPGACLFQLGQDQPSFSSSNLEISFGACPAPLGTRPTATGFGFDWPLYGVALSGHLEVMEVQGHRVLSLFMRRDFAERACANRADAAVVELSQSECARRLASVGKAGELLVCFNYEPGVPFQARRWQDFLEGLR